VSDFTSRAIESARKAESLADSAVYTGDDDLRQALFALAISVRALVEAVEDIEARQ
jgi:hypothetical protein